MVDPPRGVLRLIVSSPDGARVLARPNGLAGWALPTIPVELPFAGWDERTRDRAAGVVGTPVEPVQEVEPGCWAVTPTDRVPAAGRTWVGVDEVERLGADAAVVRAWAERPG